MTQQTQNFNRSSQTNKGLNHDEPATSKVGNNIEKDEPRAQGSSGVEQAAPTTRQSTK